MFFYSHTIMDSSLKSSMDEFIVDMLFRARPLQHMEIVDVDLMNMLGNINKKEIHVMRGMNRIAFHSKYGGLLSV